MAIELLKRKVLRCLTVAIFKHGLIWTHDGIKINFLVKRDSILYEVSKIKIENYVGKPFHNSKCQKNKKSMFQSRL